MRFLALLLGLFLVQAAAAEPMTIRILVLDDHGEQIPAPGARVAVLDANMEIAAEDALAATPHTADAEGLVTIDERPFAGEPLHLIAGMALRAIVVEKLEAHSSEAELVLPPEAVLKVVVRSPTGRALPGTEVMVAREGRADTGGFLQPGTVYFREYTDASGRCLFYRMDGSARYRVLARAKRSPAVTMRDVAVLEDAVEVYLERGAVVQGRVIAVPVGTPVAGAVVIAGEASAKTNAKGEFELSGVKPGLHTVEVSAAGRKYTEDLRIVVRAGETRSGVLLRVQGLGRLSGRLLGTDTRPAVGAAIHLRYPELPELADDLPPGGIVMAGLSDEEGMFDFAELLPAQGVDLIATHPQFAPAVYYGYSILAGQSFETLILFRRGGSLSGTVVSGAGLPVADAELWVLDSQDDAATLLAGQAPLPLTVSRTKSTADGAFELKHIVPGLKAVVVRHPDHLPLVLRGVDVSDREDRAGLRLTLGIGAELRGTVLGADGAPAKDAEITLNPPIGSALSVRSDEQGAFLLTGLPAGSFSMRVVHPDHMPFEVSRIVPPVEALTINLVRGRGIEGRVLLDDGQDSAPSAVIRLLLQGPPDPLAPDRPDYSEVVRIRAAAPDAAFAFEHIRPGNYRLEAWSPDGLFGFVDGIELTVGAVPAPVEIRIRGGWGITGVVLSGETGTALEGATVAVVGITGTPEPYRDVTDENGVFTIPSVAPGFHTIHADAQGYCPQVVASVEVRRGVETMVPEIVLTRGSWVRGSVRGIDGLPLRGLALRIKSALHRVCLTARTDEWGEFSIPNVAPGHWLLTLEWLSDAAELRREQRLVSVETGEDFQLDLRFGEGTTLSGQVTRAGVPVPHTVIEVFLLSGQLPGARQVLTATTDADGLYWVSGLPAGPVLVFVSAGARDSPSARFRLEVQSGAEQRQDLILPLSGIEGVVEDLDTGGPVSGAVIEIVRHEPVGERSFLARVEAEVGVARSTGDGVFRVEGLPAGAYRLVARRPGYGEAVLESVRVFAGGLSPVRLLLPPAGEVSGRVLDDAGRPLTGALVGFSRSRDGRPVGEADLRSDSAGRFRADFLPPGRYSVTAEARGYGRGRVADIDVSAGGSIDLEIRLAAEGRLKIHVFGPGALAIVGARVSLRDFWGHSVPFQRPPLGLLTPWRDPAVTDRDGSVTVLSLAPGIYEIHATHPDLAGPPARVRVLDGEMARAAVTLLPPREKR